MTVRILRGDCRAMLATLPDESVHCVVTSPPYYGLRSYIPDSHDLKRFELGLEPTLQEYIDNMVAVFREVRRVLRSDGTLWLNIGDSYNSIGHKKSSSGYGTTGLAGGVAQEHSPLGRETGVRTLKHKDLIGVPWRLAFALQADGWWLRSEIIWAKKSCMPESVRDRPTKSHEQIFLLAKSESYFYDSAAASEPVVGDPDSPRNQWNTKDYEIPGQKPQKRVSRSGNKARKGATERGCPEPGVAGSIPWEGSTRNWRDVWSLGPEPFKEAHFATFPSEIPRRAITAGTSEKGCCPACGAPWVPSIDRKFSAQEDVNATDGVRGAGAQKPMDASNGWQGFPRGTTSKIASSWGPSCKCGPPVAVPCTVLDPFLGSGTTALVADQLQRHCIGIELNQDYASMAERRIRGAAPLFAEIA